MKTKFFACIESIFLVIYISFFSHVLLAQEAQRPDFQEVMKSMKTHGGPSRFIEPFMKIYALDHPGFGAYIVPLKDVNGDGYNDFAVSTSLDTTFIFFGGPNLDDKPDGFVLGGEVGLVAIDFNSDGYTDIITSQIRNDPEGRGAVNIYLHNKTSSMYDSIPSLKIVGRNRLSGFGRMNCGDFNSDSISDILISSQDLNGAGTNASRGVLWLYLGKAIPDTIPDAQILDPHIGEVREQYARIFYVSDLNNDGYDDIVASGRGKRTINDTSLNNHDVYLGNKRSMFGAPDKIITHYQGHRIDFVDFNGDGCKEAHFFTQNPWPYIAWGHCEDFKSAQDFLPDTTFPNEETATLAWAGSISQVGDIDASGFNDYVICWQVSFQQTIIGVTGFVYRGGPGWQSKAVAYYGLDPFYEHVYGNPYPLTDITGDGIDDWALTSSYYTQSGKRFWAPIWLYKGDRSLATDVKHPVQIKEDILDFTIYPNPVVTQHATIDIDINANEETEATISVVDVYGRGITSQRIPLSNAGKKSLPLDCVQFRSGVYFITARTNTTSRTKPFLVLEGK